MYHNFLIHSSAYGYLGFFHVLAIVNSAAVNIGVRVSLSNEYLGLIFFRLTGLISLQSKGFSSIFSSTTIQKHQFFNA